MRIKREGLHAIIEFDGADWNKDPNIGIARPFIEEIKKLPIAHRHYSAANKEWVISANGMVKLDKWLDEWVAAHMQNRVKLTDWKESEEWLNQFEGKING